MLETDINNTINDIHDWMNRNNLQINIDKTKAIQFRTYKAKKLNLDIKHENENIDIVNYTQFLGIIIDENLSWKDQVDNVCKKINKFVFALNRIKRVASMQSALQAYHGYVSSVLRYGLVIWGNSVDFERAFKAQKRCIRALSGIQSWESCQPWFRKYKILTLPCMYIAELCLFVKRYPELFVTQYQRNENVRKCRQNKLCIPKINLAIFRKNVYCMAIKIYNKLPMNMRDLPVEKNIFKKSLFSWLSEQGFYSIKEYLDQKSA